jgi:uncharacterized protein YecT (DUF1311 family)
MVAAAVATALLASAAPAAAAPSFNCATAKTYREKAVCRDDRLARLDDEMSRAFAAALARLDPGGAEALRKDQRDFLEGIDVGFDHLLASGHGAEATERDLARALGNRGGSIAGLADELGQRSRFLKSIEPGRKTPIGTWQNATSRLSVRQRDGRLVVGFEANTFGWARYHCEFEAEVVRRDDALEADAARNLDVDTEYANRLTLRQHGARLELRETVAEDKFNGWTCPHRSELNEVLFSVR